MKPRDGRSQIFLADHGEAPSEYSPQVHAALAIFFAGEITGEKMRLENLAEASGVSKSTLSHYVKGIRYQMGKILREKVKQ